MTTNDDLENKIISLEKEIHQIQLRNKRVELDKTWETSTTRKVVIGILTYFVVLLVMYYTNVTHPATNAIIPTLGFILSTFSLSFFKGLWLKCGQK